MLCGHRLQWFGVAIGMTVAPSNRGDKNSSKHKRRMTACVERQITEQHCTESSEDRLQPLPTVLKIMSQTKMQLKQTSNRWDWRQHSLMITAVRRRERLKISILQTTGSMFSAVWCIQKHRFEIKDAGQSNWTRMRLCKLRNGFDGEVCYTMKRHGLG